MCFFFLPQPSDSGAEEVSLASTTPWAPPLQQSRATWDAVLGAEGGADLPSTLLRTGCLALLVRFVLFFLLHPESHLSKTRGIFQPRLFPLLLPAVVYVGASNLYFFPAHKLLPELSKDVHVRGEEEINREAVFNFSVCQKGGNRALAKERFFWTGGVPRFIFQATF